MLRFRLRPPPNQSALPQRRIVLRFAAAAVVCVSVGLGQGGRADAAASLTIDHVDTSHFPAVRVTVTTARPTALQGLTVVENGQQISDIKLPDVHATTAIALAVDTSQSMRGRRLHDVIDAASQFVHLQRPNELVAVYGFAARPYPVSPFSVDRVAAVAALQQVGVNGPPGTATYAAVDLIAHDATQVSAARKALILVTDGQSYRDPATLSEAITAAKAAHLSIYPVVILTPVADVQALSRLASATGGALVTASKTSQLQRVYRNLSQELGGTYTFTYDSRGSWAKPIQLVLRTPGPGRAAIIVHAPKPHTVTSKGPSVQVPTSRLAQILLAVGLTLGLGIAAIGSLKLLELRR